MSAVVVSRDLNRRMCLGLAGHGGVWQLGPSLSSWARPLAAVGKTSRWQNGLLRRSLRYFHRNAKMKQTRGLQSTEHSSYSRKCLDSDSSYIVVLIYLFIFTICTLYACRQLSRSATLHCTALHKVHENIKVPRKVPNCTFFSHWCGILKKDTFCAFTYVYISLSCFVPFVSESVQYWVHINKHGAWY